MGKTICWDCKNACANCPWPSEFKPVDGWDATMTKIHTQDGRDLESFIVHHCPLFVKDTFGLEK